MVAFRGIRHYSETMKRRLLLPALLLLFCFTLYGEAFAEPVMVVATPVPLNKEAPEDRRVGKLTYRGGLHLSAGHPAFGGLSALGSTADGSSLLAITDRGFRVELVPDYDETGNLNGIIGADISPLIGVDGDLLGSKASSDAESLSPGANGEVIVSFERRHRLLMYPPGEMVPVPIPPPDGIGDAPDNGGMEALTLLADGRPLAITEAYGAAGQRIGWISDRQGWSPMVYTVSDGFDPTGAATLPDGDVLVLERAYGLRDGSRARIRRIAAHTIEPGAQLEGDLIAELDKPFTVDNMEGITVRPLDPGSPDNGKVIIYLVSDDNFNPSDQRTLLMMFELED